MGMLFFQNSGNWEGLRDQPIRHTYGQGGGCQFHKWNLGFLGLTLFSSLRLTWSLVCQPLPLGIPPHSRLLGVRTQGRGPGTPARLAWHL